MAEARRSFGPVVLVGLAAAGGAALAGHKTWVSVGHGGVADPVSAALAAQLGDTVGDDPLAGALGLVTLACWGVLLVTRGRFRRAIAVLAALAALGVVATWVDALLTLPDEAARAWTGAGDARTGFTAWFWVAGVAAVVAVLAGAAAVRLVPAWPEMGRKYDAPAGAAAVPATEDADSLELWKALDRGQDPTAERPE